MYSPTGPRPKTKIKPFKLSRGCWPHHVHHPWVFQSNSSNMLIYIYINYQMIVEFLRARDTGTSRNAACLPIYSHIRPIVQIKTPLHRSLFCHSACPCLRGSFAPLVSFLRVKRGVWNLIDFWVSWCSNEPAKLRQQEHAISYRVIST